MSPTQPIREHDDFSTSHKHSRKETPMTPMTTIRRRIAALMLAFAAVLGTATTVTALSAAPAHAFPHNPGQPQ